MIKKILCFFVISTLSLFSLSFANEDNQEIMLRLNLPEGTSWDQKYEFSHVTNISETPSFDIFFNIHYEVPPKKTDVREVEVLAYLYEFSMKMSKASDQRQITSPEFPKTCDQGFVKLIFTQDGKLMRKENIEGCKKRFAEILWKSRWTNNGNEFTVSQRQIDGLIEFLFEKIQEEMTSFFDYYPHFAISPGVEWVSETKVQLPWLIDSTNMLMSLVCLKSNEHIKIDGHGSFEQSPFSFYSKVSLTMDNDSGWIDHGIITYKLSGSETSKFSTFTTMTERL